MESTPAPYNGMYCLVVSAPSYRDTIYVGTVTRHGDTLRIENAVMVVYYEQVATAGLARNPSGATNIRTVGGEVYVYLPSVAQITPADEVAWSARIATG